jgi:hypothetical protein
MVRMVEQLISNFKVVGSTPTTLFEIFSFFIHIFIIFSIHDVSPAVVETCLKVHKREIFYGSDFEFFTIS